MAAKASSQSGGEQAPEAPEAPGTGTVQIPDFVVRQVGALQLQLAAANETIQQQAQQIVALRAGGTKG